MALDSPTLDVLALVGAVAGVLALLIALVAVATLRSLRRKLVLLAAEDDESFLDAVARQVTAVDRMRGEIGEARTQLETTRLELADAIRHVAVVRFDAFADMGGRMSFSAALLDDSGDGIVLTSINGRSETRTYAKGVKSGQGQQQLSSEEQQAITFAQRSASGEYSLDGEEMRPDRHSRSTHSQAQAPRRGAHRSTQ